MHMHEAGPRFDYIVFSAGHISFVSFGRFKRLALQSKADLPLALVRHNLRQREGASHKLRLQFSRGGGCARKRRGVNKT